MDCEQASQLISAELDHEIQPDDSARLAEHLGACEACRSAVEVFRAQDAELRRAYAGCEPAATRVTERVLTQLQTMPPKGVVMSGNLAKLWYGSASVRWLLPAAALVAGVALVLTQFLNTGTNHGTQGPAPLVRGQVVPGVGDLDFLTPRHREDAPAVAAKVGDEIQTTAGQRKRVTLADGSILYVNENTTVKLTAERRVQLDRGEVFVEVAPAGLTNARTATFTVQTPKRSVEALGTKFAVQAEQAGTGVVVTQGKVKVSGLSNVVGAGQQLTPGTDKVGAAPRTSHVLDWTRELMIAAESPLVPRSKHCGGALIALDPHGQEAQLSLRKYHIDVHIEDGFARTTIDQTYFNHHAWRLEGTFHFPLPADASLSRLAMYVANGNESTLMEGGMAERDYARNVFEQIVFSQRDPALLEWVDGSTFKMRVFPLEGRQEKRIILSYTQKLDSLYGYSNYRFPSGHSMQIVGDWSFAARIRGGANSPWSSGSHELKAKQEGTDLLLEASAKSTKPSKDVTLRLTDGNPNGEPVRFSSAMHDGARYLMLRFQPQLQTKAEKQRRDWVFLYEASGDRDPVLARAQIDVIKTLLDNAEHDDTFTILTANTRVFTFNKEARKATPANIKAAVEWLEKTHLIGALDLGQAFSVATPILKNSKNPILVHVGSGIGSIGERKDDVLAKSLPDDVPYVGVGVGKRWGRGFMKQAAERTSGTFTQINPDESIGWRAFELSALLNTPRLLNVKVVDNAEKVKFLTYTTTLAQGEELCAIARIDPEVGTLPETITVSATLDKKTFTQVIPVAKVAEKADYLPRTWAKLEIDRLLAEDGTKNKAKIVELSKAMYVMTPFTSLLVLENEAMYQQFKVDRGRKDHWAMYGAPAKIPTVYEPDQGQGRVWWNPRWGAQPTNVAASAQKLTQEQVMQSILVRLPARFFVGANPYFNGHQAINALQLAQISYAIPQAQGGLNELEELQKTATTRGAGPGQGGLIPPMAAAPRFAAPDPMGGRNANMDRALQMNGMDALRRREMAGDGRFAQRQQMAQDEGLLRRLDQDQLSTMQSAGEILGALKNIEKASEGRGEQLRKRLEAAPELTSEAIVARLISGYSRSSMLYQRPGFGGDERYFADLLAHAPAMNTTSADIQAVIADEAKPESAQAPGQVDEAAAKLIEQARKGGWQQATIAAQGSEAAYTVFFNAAGEYRYERVLPEGLKEIVVCDGKTLVHLYPEIGVGAKRELSRFHRSELMELVPSILLPTEDLMLGNDVKAIDAQTVHVIPRGAAEAKNADGTPKAYHVVQLSFADERLIERRIVAMPSNKLVWKETYSRDGTAKFTDADGKTVAERKLALAAAEKPDLKPDTKSLVVLPLPYRTQQHVFKAYELKDWNYNNIKDEAALALFGACLFQQNWQAHQIYVQCFHNRGKKLPGFYALLAAAGMNQPRNGQVDFAAVLSNEPIVKYLVQVNAGTADADGLGVAKDSFLYRLAAFRTQYRGWNTENPFQGLDANAKQAKIDRTFGYIKENASSVYGWAILSLVSEKAANDAGSQKGIAELYKLFEQTPGLSYAAKYEVARGLEKAGQRAEARKRFKALYEAAQNDSLVPAIDSAFRKAMVSDDNYKQDLWSTLLRETATQLIAKKQRTAVIALAWQARQLDDMVLADAFLDMALANLPEAERLTTTLSGVEYLWQTGQQERADQLLQTLLADAEYSKNPILWRLASQLTGQRKLLKRSVEYFDKALEMEYRQLPTVINLTRVRSDYGRLLNAYQQVAVAMSLLETPVPADFTARVIRAADRWRALDSDPTAACQAAARILRYLGAKELAWDYLTTPTALRPNESGPQLALAQALRNEGDFELADKAYALAFEAESSNAQILWERAQALQQAGKTADAQRLYRQIAEGEWQPRFQWLKNQARYQMGNR